MLKKLRIINFESHKDTTIQFSDGFNVFQGDSDGGKSAIIRAIAAVCYNKWTNQSVRLGEEQTVIQLTTELGIVRLTKNPVKKINTYSGKIFETNEQFYFQSVGTTVPQVVFHITGMRQLNVGDSITDIPNIMFQLQKHYMLAQVSGKACTSNLIARVFDKVIGLGGMQQLINQISSSMLSDKKNITKNMAQIDQMKLNLIPQQDIQELQSKLDKILFFKQNVIKLQNDLKSINYYLDQQNKIKEKLSKLDFSVLNFDSDLAINCLNKTLDINKLFINANNICIKQKSIIDLIQQSNNKLNKCVNVQQNILDGVKKTCNKLYVASKILNGYTEKNKKLQIINSYLNQTDNINEAKEQLEKSKLNCNLLYKVDKILNKKCKFDYDISKCNNSCELYQKQFNQLSQQLIHLKKQCKICPLCGKKF